MKIFVIFYMFLFSSIYAAEVNSFQSLTVKFTKEEARAHIILKESETNSLMPYEDVVLIYRFTPGSQEKLKRSAKNILMMMVPLFTEGVHNQNFNAYINDPHILLDCGQGRNDAMVKKDAILFFAPEMIYSEIQHISQKTKTFVTFSQTFSYDIAKILFADVLSDSQEQESPIISRVKSLFDF